MALWFKRQDTNFMFVRQVGFTWVRLVSRKPYMNIEIADSQAGPWRDLDAATPEFLGAVEAAFQTRLIQ